MEQESGEEQQTRDHRGHPHLDAAPLRRHRTEMLGKRKRNQQGDDEPAVVKTDRDAGDSADLDLCLHGREISQARHNTLVF